LGVEYKETDGLWEELINGTLIAVKIWWRLARPLTRIQA
jgi:hypothetical protein